MNIKEIMSSKPIFCEPNSSIQEAAKKMSQEKIGCIPICENGKLVGTVTDRDIAVRCVARGSDCSLPVKEIMTKEVVTCRENENIEKAAHEMEGHKLHRLLVVDNDQHLKGIVSLSDLAIKSANDRLTCQVAKAVGRY